MLFLSLYPILISMQPPFYSNSPKSMPDILAFQRNFKTCFKNYKTSKLGGCGKKIEILKVEIATGKV